MELEVHEMYLRKYDGYKRGAPFEKQIRPLVGAVVTAQQ